MSHQNNSIETINDLPLRRMVDLGTLVPAIEKAATEDGYVNGILYSFPEYVREILNQFLYIREHCRQEGLPLYRPVDIADAIITGDITINSISSKKK